MVKKHRKTIFLLLFSIILMTVFCINSFALNAENLSLEDNYILTEKKLNILKTEIKSLYTLGLVPSSSYASEAVKSENDFSVSENYFDFISVSQKQTVDELKTLITQAQKLETEILWEAYKEKEHATLFSTRTVLETSNISISSETLTSNNKLEWDLPVTFNLAEKVPEHTITPPVSSAPEFISPCPDYAYISDLWDIADDHKGLDFAAYHGTEILASASGVVTTTNTTDLWGEGWGYYTTIEHNESYSTRYAHCSSVIVKEGDVVEKGDVIAYVGTTGKSTGNHLHFEIYENGTRVDPMQFLIEN